MAAQYSDLLAQLKLMGDDDGQATKGNQKENLESHQAQQENKKNHEKDVQPASVAEKIVSGGSKECRDPYHVLEPLESKNQVDSDEEEIMYWLERFNNTDDEQLPTYECRRYTCGSEDIYFKVFVEQRLEPYDAMRQILPPNVTILGNKSNRRKKSCLPSCFKFLSCMPRKRQNAGERYSRK